MTKVERFFIDLRTIYLFFKLSFFEIWLHTVNWKDRRCTVWWVLTNVYTIPQSRIMHCSHKFPCVISHSFPSSLATPSGNHFSDFYPHRLILLFLNFIKMEACKVFIFYVFDFFHWTCFRNSSLLVCVAVPLFFIAE